MSDVKVTIDNMEVNVPEGSTLLEAAHIAGVDIPTLCYLKDVMKSVHVECVYVK